MVWLVLSDPQPQDSVGRGRMTTDIRTPCAVCGTEVARPDPHHIEPRGRRPDLVHDPANIADVCRPCHDQLEPEGTWRVERQGDYWQTLDVQTGELICRRPIQGDQSKALALLESVGGLADYRDKDRRLLTLASLATDDEVLMLAEYGSRMRVGGAAVQMIAHYEAWMRYPNKLAPNWAEKLAKSFGCSDKAIYEDVRATELYASDEGPPLDASWYRQACHAQDRQAAVKLAHEVHEGGGSITDFRKSLGLPSANREKHECPLCHQLHVIKEGP